MSASLVGSEMCIRDSIYPPAHDQMVLERHDTTICWSAAAVELSATRGGAACKRKSRLRGGCKR
eukprot:15338447-Alexandrium_andersonii.AAC.1